MPTVTYSPEDNKLRLYVGRVPRDEYEALRAAGFVSTPKQSCDFVATWTPAREDLAMSYLEDGEDIEDEDYSPEERAADKAERLAGYRDKRAEEAGMSADAFEAGPSAFGHQNRARAERQAMRHDRKRTYAVSQWSKAEYWQQRTAGVIAHALHKSSASVRRGRILTLEAEQRKHLKSWDEYAERFAKWQTVANLDGADERIPEDWRTGKIAAKVAYMLAGNGRCWGDYEHPRTGRKASVYTLLTDPQDPITPREAATLWLAGKTHPSDETTHGSRWTRHYELRLTYERAMLAGDGGSAADAEMERGGWIGSHQIHKVNKSPVTGRVVSVTLKMPGDRWGNTREGYHMRAFNVERLPEGAYRAPTDAEREDFATATKERKAAEKARKPVTPSLINPTEADAERLQALWNERAKSRYEKSELERYGKIYGDFKPATIRKMTQAEYSAASGGSYSHCETMDVAANGFPHPGRWNDSAERFPTAFKIRKSFASASCSATPYRIIVITDKPQKPLPLDWANLDKPIEAKPPTPAKQLELIS